MICITALSGFTKHVEYIFLDVACDTTVRVIPFLPVLKAICFIPPMKLHIPPHAYLEHTHPGNHPAAP